MTARTAASCWLIAGIAYVGLEAIAAHAVPGYAYAHDFISDLGRPASPLHPLMNAAFVLQGTLFLAGAALVVRAVARRARSFVVFAAANAVGNIMVASVPSGSPGIAWVHVTGATLAILGGNAAIVAGTPVVNHVGARSHYRAISLGLAALGLLSFAMLAMSTASITVLFPAAVWERTSVYTIILWQTMSALQLLA